MCPIIRHAYLLSLPGDIIDLLRMGEVGDIGFASPSRKPKTVVSVADPACLSRIPDPDFYPSRIPDPGSRIQKQQQKREVKKISCHTFLCSHKFHKIVNYFSFEVLKKKIWTKFSKNYRTFYQKNCQKALKNMVLGSGIRDPRSGIRKKPIPDPGFRGQKAPDPGSRIRIRNTDGGQNFLKIIFENKQSV
jgi:hypothetical protein